MDSNPLHIPHHITILINQPIKKLPLDMRPHILYIMQRFQELRQP